MSVTIIKAGSLPPPKTLGGKCDNCGAVIECLVSDCKPGPAKTPQPPYLLDCPTQGCGAVITAAVALVVIPD